MLLILATLLPSLSSSQLIIQPTPSLKSYEEEPVEPDLATELQGNSNYGQPSTTKIASTYELLRNDADTTTYRDADWAVGLSNTESNNDQSKSSVVSLKAFLIRYFEREWLRYLVEFERWKDPSSKDELVDLNVENLNGDYFSKPKSSESPENDNYDHHGHHSYRRLNQQHDDPLLNLYPNSRSGGTNAAGKDISVGPKLGPETLEMLKRRVLSTVSREVTELLDSDTAGLRELLHRFGHHADSLQVESNARTMEQDIPIPKQGSHQGPYPKSTHMQISNSLEHGSGRKWDIQKSSPVNYFNSPVASQESGNDVESGGNRSTRSMRPTTCYMCKHSYDGLSGSTDDTCKLFDQFNNDMNMEICAKSEDSCMTEVYSREYIFYSVVRGCTNNCKPGCFHVGYGVTLSMCRRCCYASLCNGWDDPKFYARTPDIIPERLPFVVMANIIISTTMQLINNI